MRSRRRLRQRTAKSTNSVSKYKSWKYKRLALPSEDWKPKKDWGDRIQKYITDFHEQYERSWDSISTYTIVKELRKRGWQGTIFNNDPDMAEEHKEGVIAAFNGKATDNID